MASSSRQSNRVRESLPATEGLRLCLVLYQSSISYREEKMAMVPSIFGNRRSSIFDSFSFVLWDPFKDFPFSSSASLSAHSPETSAFVNTQIDWKETPEAHVFKADLPGVKKEEVKVEIEDDRALQISGERNVEKEDKKDTWHRVERSSGMFTRRFRLPDVKTVEISG